MTFRNASASICIVFATVIISLVTVTSNPATKQDKPLYRTTGDEGNLVGTVSFVGVPPEPRRIDVSADPICETINPEPTTQDVIVTDGKLANVFVYIRAGYALDAYSFEAPLADVSLEHKGCQYVPRALGMQTQQILKVLNSDPTTHNTHPTPKINPEWNQSQPPGVPAIERRFERRELFIPVKDNQHPWEKAYVGVFSHPFFAISDKDGFYKIASLPPGQYTIVAWHEKYGEQKIDVSIDRREDKRLDFTFRTPEN
jgi:hypothetical protein